MNKELIIDLFAGGGGASTGIEQAVGRNVFAAVNHDPEALGMHAENHPKTRHHCTDIFEIDPLTVTQGQPVGLLWASPDCKHFSKAKGGKPVDNKIRSLAWVVIRWAREVKPRIIFVENVEEFKTWGPLKGNRPDPAKKGQTFNRWVFMLRRLGYQVEWRELRACDYGAPTIRKRLFIVARRDGQPIVWPEPTHGDPKDPQTAAKGLLPWRTSADCIDWSLPCPSIFERKKELSPNTLRRIARGIMKYVVNTNEPYIIQINPKSESHALVCATIVTNTTGHPGAPADEPLRTITTGRHHAVVTPLLAQVGYGEAQGQQPRVNPPGKPMWTVVSGGNHAALVAAFISKHYTGATGSNAKDPVGTVTAIDHNSVVTSHIAKLRGENTGHGTNEPLHTVSARGQHFAEVRAFLHKYYGNEKSGAKLFDPAPTVTSKDHIGVVTVCIQGQPYVITDIGMRMLQPKELYAAQGFPDTYVYDRTADGKKINKAGQVRMCGNAVCPPLARALVKANFKEVK